MIKYFCDICGNEINKPAEKWRFELAARPENPRVSFDDERPEICEKCATILHCSVSMMKQGWEPNFHEVQQEN